MYLLVDRNRPTTGTSISASSASNPEYSNPLDGAYFWKGERAEEISRRSAIALRVAEADLLRSHEESRAALRLAGAEISKLNFGRKDTPILKQLRRVLGNCGRSLRWKRLTRGRKGAGRNVLRVA
jgi:hypothetical protein